MESNAKLDNSGFVALVISEKAMFYLNLLWELLRKRDRNSLNDFAWNGALLFLGIICFLSSILDFYDCTIIQFW